MHPSAATLTGPSAEIGLHVLVLLQTFRIESEIESSLLPLHSVLHHVADWNLITVTYNFQSCF